MIPYLFTLLSLLPATPEKLSYGTITFNATMQGEPMQLHTMYATGHGNDSVSLSTCKFYIIDIVLLDGSKVVGEPELKYILIDLSDSSSLNIPFVYKGHFNGIRFTLGVDSATNMSGPKAGALDPVNGMYWTWQSGYINAKIEGNRTGCDTTREFLYHIGGYHTPEQTAIETYRICKTSDQINVNLAMDRFFAAVTCDMDAAVQIPGAKAHALAAYMSASFVITQ